MRGSEVNAGIPGTWTLRVTSGIPGRDLRTGVRFPPPPLSKAATFHILSLRPGLPPTRRVPVSFQIIMDDADEPGAERKLAE